MQRVHPVSRSLVLLCMCLVPALALADRASRRTAVVEVVERVSPAVVHIATEQIVDERVRSADLFDQLFGDLLGERDRRRAVTSLGSGAIIDPSGIIVTNEHVIRGASAIHVNLADGRQLDADVIGSDADNDLAVLKVKSNQPLPVAKLGTSSDLMIGEQVIAIGSPFGLSKTVTVGVVSAVGRSFRADNRVYNDFIQTDASINPGNSGGPLLDSSGRLIGINTAIYSPTGAYAGIGFAVPVDTVNLIVPQLLKHGKIVRPGLGISIANDQHAARGGIDGVVIMQIVPGGAADKAGLQGATSVVGGIIPSDVIVGIDNVVIHKQNDLFKALDQHKVGDVVDVQVDNKQTGKRRTVKVTLQAIQ